MHLLLSFMCKTTASALVALTRREGLPRLMSRSSCRRPALLPARAAEPGLLWSGAHMRADAFRFVSGVRMVAVRGAARICGWVYRGMRLQVGHVSA